MHLLGTAHVSRQSCEDARQVIEDVQPEVVVLELCQKRAVVLEGGDGPDDAKEGAKDGEPTVADAGADGVSDGKSLLSSGSSSPSEVSGTTSSGSRAPESLSEAVRRIRSGEASPFEALYGWLLRRVGDELETQPGAEFRSAARAAEVAGAEVVLGDRPVDVTLARVWGALTTWDRVRLLASMLGTGAAASVAPGKLKDEIESLKDGDALSQAVAELAGTFPALVPPLLSERDAYLVASLRGAAERAVERAKAAAEARAQEGLGGDGKVSGGFSSRPFAKLPSPEAMGALSLACAKAGAQAPTAPSRAAPSGLPQVKIVGIVGAGHLRGIEKMWASDVDLTTIMKLPERPTPRPYRRLAIGAVALATGAAAVVAVVRRRRQAAATPSVA